MNDEVAFPAFIPAKPKGGVAAEIAQAKIVEGVVEFKPKRKRRTRAEMAQASPAGERDNAFAIYCEIVDKLAYVDKKTRMLMFKMLMDNHT